MALLLYPRILSVLQRNWIAWDPQGQFLDSGKKLCWALTSKSKDDFWRKFGANGSKTAKFALGACPWILEVVHLKRIVKAFPNASNVMLVRDPVGRAILDMNAWMFRHKSINQTQDFETLLRQPGLREKFIHHSMFGITLRNAYSVSQETRY